MGSHGRRGGEVRPHGWMGGEEGHARGRVDERGERGERGTHGQDVLIERTQAIKKLGSRLCQVNFYDRYEDCYVP